MEGSELVGEQTVFVHQETEASLLLQQSLLAAVRGEQLHVHLTARQRFQALTTNTRAHTGDSLEQMQYFAQYMQVQSLRVQKQM